MFDDVLLDDQTALEAVDGELRSLAESGARVRREVQLAAEQIAALDGGDRPRAAVVAGYGSRLLRAVLEPRSPIPFVAWPGLGLPGWVGPLDLVVVLAQGSGDKAAETAVAEARRRGSRLVVTCTPHSPVAELVQGPDSTLLPVHSDDLLAGAVLVLQALAQMGLGPSLDGEEIAAALDQIAIDCSPLRNSSENQAKELAIVMGDANPLLWGGSSLSGRAARRIAEAVRRTSGRPAIAGPLDQLLPLVQAAPPKDFFADPVESGSGQLRPAVVLVDDGLDTAASRTDRGALVAEAERRDVWVETVTYDRGSDVARYAALLMIGRYAAVYLGVGLGGSSPE